jgi:hypothetical protein
MCQTQYISDFGSQSIMRAGKSVTSSWCGIIYPMKRLSLSSQIPKHNTLLSVSFVAVSDLSTSSPAAADAAHDK